MTFAASVARLFAEIQRLGLDVHDMRGERHLELSLVVDPDIEREAGDQPQRPPILWREPIPSAPRAVQGAAASRLCAFLDGAQRTLPTCFSATVPIVTSVTAAAILGRDATGDCRVSPGMLRFQHSWLVPLRSPDPAVQRLAASVTKAGGLIVDPLERLEDESAYETALQDFGRMVQLAYDQARRIRQQVEEELLRAWAAARRVGNDGWIVVDGALRFTVPRAVGVVKSFTRQYLTGAEAAAIFRLPPGHRSPAFQVHDAWWRKDPVTAWYLRLWDATGRDPRHALVRVETAASVTDTAQIDELSAWLLAERIPRATADARWATLLYPVHYLEEILKRYLDAQTRGWPSPR